jgi:hypothetical protein
MLQIFSNLRNTDSTSWRPFLIIKWTKVPRRQKSALVSVGNRHSRMLLLGTEISTTFMGHRCAAKMSLPFATATTNPGIWKK